MFTLTPEDQLGHGANRACYRLPDDSGRCVKLDLGPTQGTRAGTNQIEFAHHKTLSDRLGEVFYEHAPRCYGFVQTSLGEGLCFELVHDADGQPSLSLDRYLAEGRCTTEQALELVDQLQAFVHRHAVKLFDVNLKNLLAKRDEQGRVRLIVIDWKGPAVLREFIPASRYVPLFARMKINRRFNRLRQHVRAVKTH